VTSLKKKEAVMILNFKKKIIREMNIKIVLEHQMK
jgi:hypothetical protein